MALSGQSTVYLVFNSTATAASYSGTLTGVVAGELIVVVIACDGNANAQDPSGYTVTLGSDTLTYRAGQGTSLNVGFSAIYTGVATASGDQTLTVTTTNSLRAMAAHAFRITGFDTTTPVPNAGQNDNHGSTVTSLTSPNGVTTAADGNAIIGGISIHGGTVTGLAVGSADGSTVGETGSSGFSDCEWGVAWQTTPTAASVTFAWTWATANRPGAAWVEIAEAAGSGVTATPGAGAASLGGQAPASGAGATAAAGSGGATVHGLAPTATAGGAATVTPGVGALAVLGLAPTATAGGAATVTPGVGALAVLGLAPTATAGGAVSVTPGVGALAVLGLAPTATAGGAVSVTPGSVMAQGQAPAAAANVNAHPGAGAVSVQGRAVTASVGGMSDAATGAGAVAASGIAPSPSAGVTVVCGAGAVTVAGGAATTSAGVTLAAGAGSVMITGHAPSVVAQGLINFIILAAPQPPTFRAIGGRGAANVLGGRGRFRTIGGGG